MRQISCLMGILLLILLVPSAVAAQMQPDLEVYDMSLSPPITIHQGEVLIVRWSERNLGSAPATYRVGIYLGTKEYETGFLLAYFVHSLSGNSFGSYAANVTIPLELPPGKYYITVFVDDMNEVLELNEGNNIKTRPIFIVEALPDLTVGDLHVSPLEQGVIRVEWVELNAGIKAAGPYRVGIYISEEEQGSGYLMSSFERSGLISKAKSHYTAVFTILGLPPGRYFVKVFIDDTNSVNEINEDNNIISHPISIQTPTFTTFSAVDVQSVKLCFNSPIFVPSGSIIVGGPFVNYMSAAVAPSFGISFTKDELIMNGVHYRSEWGRTDYAVILLKGGKIYAMGTHRYGTRAALLLLARMPTYSPRTISYMIIKWQDLNMNGDVDVEEIKVIRMG